MLGFCNMHYKKLCVFLFCCVCVYVCACLSVFIYTVLCWWLFWLLKIEKPCFFKLTSRMYVCGTIVLL